jgi:hypothetical protein
MIMRVLAHLLGKHAELAGRVGPNGWRLGSCVI